MANQYSNYTLAPYVSQYVNPYSVEVNTILRERWDRNKGNKDKIDATIGSWSTLPGDAHLVDKAKQQIKDKLNNFASNGNYEDAGIRMRTNDTDAFYISSGQNVGIGTTVPSQKLEISAGNIMISGSGGAGVIFKGTSDGSNKNAIYFKNASRYAY